MTENVVSMEVGRKKLEEPSTENIDLSKVERKHLGAHNELFATAWLLREGYEVFRNVSAHGAVDIVAIKDGVVEMLDVKAKQYNTIVRLTAAQRELGVKLLAVYPDGKCEIDALAPGPREQETKTCVTCGSEFVPTRNCTKYCNHECRPSVIDIRLSSKAAAERAKEAARQRLLKRGVSLGLDGLESQPRVTGSDLNDLPKWPGGIDDLEVGK